MVSIIVPVHNTEKYLDRCVESILNQSYRDIELILVDDGSTDNSLEICRKYEVQDIRVRVYHKENGGQGSARNFGLDVCKGDYICFVDSDDYIEPNLVMDLMNNLIAYHADISCGGVYSHEDRQDFVNDSNIIVKDNIEAINLFVCNKDGFNHSPVCKIFKKSVFDDVRFVELRGFEDAGTIFKAFVKAETVVSQKISLYFYLQRDTSTMHRKFSAKDYDRILAYKEMENGLRTYPQYEQAADIVTASKIGAIYYVAGEALRIGIPEKTEIIKKCQNECKNTLRSKYSISLKNKFLLNLICICPRVFGILYRMGH